MKHHSVEVQLGQPGPSHPYKLAGRNLVNLALLWLAGFCLRATMLSVPPLIPAIHRDLGLDEKGVSILTGLPVLVLAIVAIPGSLLIARLGARRALVTGLLVIGLGSIMRSAGTNLVVLFAMTLVMGAGVAACQPVFPTLTREWFPAQIALATGVYSNGLLFGEAIPASITGSVMMPALHGSWALALGAWSLPSLAAAGLIFAMAPHIGRLPKRKSADALPMRPPAERTRWVSASVDAPRRWWPDFRDPQLWRVGLILGFSAAAYFGANTFIPDYLGAAGRTDLKDPALTALNVFQLPASVTMLLLRGRLAGRRWPFVVVGATIAGAAAGLTLTPDWAVFWAAVIGYASGLALVLTLALPPLLVDSGDVARFSAGIFLLGYGLSFAGPVLGGAAWDATALPAAAMLIVAAGGAATVVLVFASPMRRTVGEPAAARQGRRAAQSLGEIRLERWFPRPRRPVPAAVAALAIASAAASACVVLFRPLPPPRAHFVATPPDVRAHDPVVVAFNQAVDARQVRVSITPALPIAVRPSADRLVVRALQGWEPARRYRLSVYTVQRADHLSDSVSWAGSFSSRPLPPLQPLTVAARTVGSRSSQPTIAAPAARPGEPALLRAHINLTPMRALVHRRTDLARDSVRLSTSARHRFIHERRHRRSRPAHRCRE